MNKKIIFLVAIIAVLVIALQKVSSKKPSWLAPSWPGWIYLNTPKKDPFELQPQFTCLTNITTS